MANQCVSEFTIIGPEEVVREAIQKMVANLKSNGVVEEGEGPSEDAPVRELAQWVSKYTGSPSCCYLEALRADGVFSTSPMGWDAQVLVSPYGELFTMRMDFDTAWGPADPEVEEFIGSLSSPCGVYYRPDTEYGHRDIWLLKDGEKQYVKLSGDFKRFERWDGEIGPFYAQMHKAITNRLPKV